jgi:DNA-binding response OmpR family regulator
MADEQFQQMPNSKVLILCDDKDAARMWWYALEKRGIESATTQIDRAFEVPTDLDSYDLVIIDHYQAETDVLSICQQIRTNFTQPLLLFTYEADERYHLKAYAMGVEECVSKPIGIPLFLAKVLAWLHRATLRMAPTHELSVSQFRFDLERRLLTTPEDDIIRLSNLESRLLQVLMANRGRTVDPQLLMNRIWLGYHDTDSRLVKNLIYRLRRKIESDPRNPKYILTVEGLGYTFRAGE